jgi:hypothetical protein
MKFNTKMPQLLIPHFEKEIQLYAQSLLQNRLDESWHHLERAHIIGQKYPWTHSFVHWKMLKFGIKIKNAKEIFGQLPRLIVGGVKSFVNYVPTGNTGGANVPPLQKMEIPKDLQELFLLIK